MLRAELGYLPIIELVKYLRYLDTVGVNDHEYVEMVNLRPIGSFTSSEPFAVNTSSVCHLHQCFEHRHLLLVRLSFKAEMIQARFLSSLEELEDRKDSVTVCSLSFSVPSTITVTINDGGGILN